MINGDQCITRKVLSTYVILVCVHCFHTPRGPSPGRPYPPRTPPDRRAHLDSARPEGPTQPETMPRSPAPARTQQARANKGRTTSANDAAAPGPPRPARGTKRRTKARPPNIRGAIAHGHARTHGPPQRGTIRGPRATQPQGGRRTEGRITGRKHDREAATAP